MNECNSNWLIKIPAHMDGIRYDAFWWKIIFDFPPREGTNTTYLLHNEPHEQHSWVQFEVEWEFAYQFAVSRVPRWLVHMLYVPPWFAKPMMRILHTILFDRIWLATRWRSDKHTKRKFIWNVCSKTEAARRWNETEMRRKKQKQKQKQQNTRRANDECFVNGTCIHGPPTTCSTIKNDGGEISLYKHKIYCQYVCFFLVRF